MPAPKHQSKAHNSSALLTAKEAATIAQISIRSVHAWVQLGCLHAVQQYPKILIDRAELEFFLCNRELSANSVVEHADDDAGQTQHLLTTMQAAAIAGVHRTTVGKWVSRGNLRSVQRRPQILIDQNDLDEFLCSQRQSEDAGHEREAPRPLQVKQEAITEEAPDTEDTSTERTVVFSRKDAAILLGVHPDTINRWRRQGRLHATSEGEIPLAEIKRLTSATIPISETQLELLKDPVSQESTQAEKGLPPWFVLARLLEASQEREVKLGQQLEVLHALLLRMTDLLGARSIGQSVYARPMDVSVTDRILTFLQAYPGPHRGTEVRDALSLPDIPTDTLQRLVERGLVKRLSPGLFEATSDPSESGPPLEPAEGTLMAKVLAYVRETTGEGSMRRGVRSWQVQQALNLPESPNRTLSRLRARGLIYRIREGIYSSKPLGANEEEENVE